MMLGLEMNKSEIDELKNQMENNLWYHQTATLYDKDMIDNKTIYVKIMLLLFVLHPLFIAPGLVILDLRPDWSIFPVDGLIRRATMLAFYVLYILGSCGIVYAHLLVFVYFSIYIKIEMEILTEYFRDVTSKFDTAEVKDDLQDVCDLLINGIKVHTKLLRYVTIFFV